MLTGGCARRGGVPTIAAVLGGTFDPVHNGHTGLATALRQALAPAQLWLMPCHEPPHRAPPQATPRQRLAMLRLAVGDGVDAVGIDPREVCRRGVSWTVDSLREYRAECGASVPLALVIGSDALAEIHSWHDWPALLDCAHLVVVPRPGVDAMVSGSVAAELLRTRGVRRGRELAEQPSGLLWWGEELPRWPQSSTSVRVAVAAGERPEGVAELVWRYIRRSQLYRSGSGASSGGGAFRAAR